VCSPTSQCASKCVQSSVQSVNVQSVEVQGVNAEACGKMWSVHGDAMHSSLCCSLLTVDGDVHAWSVDGKGRTLQRLQHTATHCNTLQHTAT